MTAATIGRDGVAKPVDDPDGMYTPAVHFFDDKTYVAGSAQQMKKYLERNPKATGNLSKALADADKHHVSAAIDVAGMQAKEAPELPREFAPLLEARLVAMTCDIGAPWKLHVEASFQDEARAKGAQQAANNALDLARAQAAALQPALKRGMTAFLDKPLTQALTGLKEAAVKQNGAVLVLDVSAPIEVKIDDDVLVRFRQAAERTRSFNNVKQILLAIHNWSATYQDELPPAAICDKEGKPLLSWRVLLLPYLEQEGLYKQFKLDEPWDSERNKKLLAKMPDIYRAPGANTKEPHETRYCLITGPGTLYPGKPGKFAAGMGLVSAFKIAGIPDGSSNTIGVVERAEPLPWTKPEDVEYDPKKLLPKFYLRGDGFVVGIMDGSVRTVLKTITEKTLRSAIEPADGKVLGNDW